MLHLLPFTIALHPILWGMVQEDLERVRAAGEGRVDVTVGSALDIFGGQLSYRDVVEWHRKQSSR